MSTDDRTGRQPLPLHPLMPPTQAELAAHAATGGHGFPACAHCGRAFVASRPDARYCTGRCRVAAHRARGERR